VGDAFNRSEVSSVYVAPKDRFVVSLVVGVSDEETPEAAVAYVKRRIGHLVWMVHDRESGESFEVKPLDFEEIRTTR
jgi:hypothetical protein